MFQHSGQDSKEEMSSRDVNYYLNSDEEDVIEWDVKVKWKDDIYEDHDTVSSFQYFKGAKWNSLIRIGRYGISAFVGINDMHQLPLDYCLNYRYSFYIKINEQDNCTNDSDIKWKHLYTGTDEAVIVRNSHYDVEEYTDVGKFNIYSRYEYYHNRHHIIDEDGCFTIQCRLKAFPKVVELPFGYDSKSSTGMVGLRNLGATCYLNSLLQMLYHINAFRKAIFHTPVEGADFADSTMLALQSTFHQLQTSEDTVSTKHLTHAFGWNHRDAFEQQDVQEMMRVLLDKIEEDMKISGDADGAVKNFFCGKIKSFIRCQHVQYESSRIEDFYDIQLNIKGCKNIIESFRQYCELEVLSAENGNQYDAENYGKQDAVKGVLFAELPPVLTIHLKRFEFDMRFSKIHDEFEFPTRLDLNEFVSGTDDEKASKDNFYILHSVLVHSGDAYGGHYYAHIRPNGKNQGESGFWGRISQNAKSPSQEDNYPHSMHNLSKEGDWFQFDDENVHPVDRRLAVDGNYGSNCDVHSAYMLVYLRESDAADLMIPVEPPPSMVEKLDHAQVSYRQNVGYSSGGARFGHSGTGFSYGYNGYNNGTDYNYMGSGFGTGYGLNNRRTAWEDRLRGGGRYDTFNNYY